jgi:hypothetical protein
LKKIWLRANLFSILKKHSIEKWFVFGDAIQNFKNNINFINAESFYQNETLKKLIKSSSVLFVQNDFLKRVNICNSLIAFRKLSCTIFYLLNIKHVFHQPV